MTIGNVAIIFKLMKYYYLKFSDKRVSWIQLSIFSWRYSFMEGNVKNYVKFHEGMYQSV